MLIVTQATPALYPQLFLPGALRSKLKASAHHLQTGVSLPHQLMTRWAITGATEIAAQARN
jgi:hypothetical protein